jgi:uncharacterized protein YdcH (DUF465 family)
MSDHGHDLHAEFPDARDALVALKASSAHFRTLSDSYHDLAQEIFRIEAGLQAASDARLDALKKERLAILDAVAAMLPARAA